MQTLYQGSPKGTSPNVLAALRDLFSKYPETTWCGAESLVELLRLSRVLQYRPAVVEVEAALEVLDMERGVA